MLAYRDMQEGRDGRTALQLRENPFYAESGGQISDNGHVWGEGWKMHVQEVRRIGGRIAVVGPIEGDFRPGRVRAVVEEPARRDTERNHTATHLLQAALRRVLGEHVFQQGSLVAPDRLRFDFSHAGPLTATELAGVERLVNEAIWANTDVCQHRMAYTEAIERGAMALFSEKYGDVVRVIEIPGVSMELCGGTHVRTTGQIGLFRVVSESGVAAGVRRIEAVTGPEAYRRGLHDRETLRELAGVLRTREENLLPRAQGLVEETRELERALERARTQGGADRVGAAPRRRDHGGRRAGGGRGGGGGRRGGGAPPGRPAARAPGERGGGAGRARARQGEPLRGGDRRPHRARRACRRAGARGGGGDGREGGRPPAPGAGRRGRPGAGGRRAGARGRDRRGAAREGGPVTEAERWLRERARGAPAPLLREMAAALPAGEASTPEALAGAALALYARVAVQEGGRELALPLLAADALLTHAFEAQVEEDPAGVAEFAARWGARGRLGEVAG